MFPFLCKKQLFQLGFDAVHGAVVFVIENFSNKRRHGLNEPRDDLIKIFKFLKTQITIFQIYSSELESISFAIFRHRVNLPSGSVLDQTTLCVVALAELLFVSV